MAKAKTAYTEELDHQIEQFEARLAEFSASATELGAEVDRRFNEGLPRKDAIRKWSNALDQVKAINDVLGMVKALRAKTA